MGVCIVYLEGEIFNDWINLSPKGSFGWDLCIICSIFNHLHPFLELQLLLSFETATPTFWPFCIFQPILLGLTWYCFQGFRAYLPTLFEPYISKSMYWHYFCSSASYKLRSHSLGFSICSSVLHFHVHVLLRLALPSLSDYFLKDLYSFCCYKINMMAIWIFSCFYYWYNNATPVCVLTLLHIHLWNILRCSQCCRNSLFWDITVVSKHHLGSACDFQQNKIKEY